MKKFFGEKHYGVIDAIVKIKASNFEALPVRKSR